VIIDITSVFGLSLKNPGGGGGGGIGGPFPDGFNSCFNGVSGI
jgi:hypothetical protein